MVSSSHKRVLLQGIDALTFYTGELTAHRRASAVPQLNCQGSACRLYQPDVVQCYNRGGSGVDIEWKCEADLPSALRLGKIQVSCEGWEHSADPYILKGSCGLEYSLKRVDPEAFRRSGGDGIISKLFWVLFIATAILILYPLLRSLLTTFLPFLDRWLPGRGGGNYPGGGGGGGGAGRWPGFGGGSWGMGGSGDPPPPYSRRPPPAKPSSGQDSTGWRPGFWTGAAAGAAASRLFGAREPQPAPMGWDFDRSPFVRRPTGMGTGWFGGGRGHPSYRGQGSSRDVDDDNLGTIRSSTGYGGTRNR